MNPPRLNSMQEDAAVETFIKGSEKLLQIFGHWPSFHDAEIINLHLWRGNVNPEMDLYQFPVLTLDVHHWELTKQVDAKGYFVLQHHTRTTLTFSDVQTVHLNGFNHQNAILGLSIKRLERAKLPSPYFSVEIVAAFGLEALLTCLSVEVTTAFACDSDGEPKSPSH